MKTIHLISRINNSLVSMKWKYCSKIGKVPRYLSVVKSKQQIPEFAETLLVVTFMETEVFQRSTSVKLKADC